MKITEVRIKLMDDPDDRLHAFCSITIDHAFVVRDLKIIGGSTGPFVAMPSRKLTAHCPQCRCKNHLRAGHCNQCGIRLKEQSNRDQDGRAKLYADIAHPINSECREMIQRVVITAYQEELARSKEPDYVPRYDDYMDYDSQAESVEPIDGKSKSEKTRVEGASGKKGPHPKSDTKRADSEDGGGGFGQGIF